MADLRRYVWAEGDVVVRRAAGPRPHAEPDPPPGPAPDQVALPGADGAKAEALLAEAKRGGSRVLAEVAASAVRRLLSGDPRKAKALFDAGEKQKLADALASVRSTAELLGRSRVRLRLARAAKHAEATDWSAFAAAAPPLLAPEAALAYFRARVPTLASSLDPAAWAEEQRRQAFALAGVTEISLLERVQEVLAGMLETGDVTKGPGRVQAVLDDAGVSESNPYRGEAIFRTEMVSSYVEGSQQELQDPDVMDSFPVWTYANPNDGRSRPEHAARDGKYYPSSVLFTDVRGNDAGDIINCRCVQIPVYKTDWQDLQRQGVTAEGV